MDGDSIIRDTDVRQPRAWPEDETLIPDWIYTDQDTKIIDFDVAAPTKPITISQDDNGAA